MLDRENFDKEMTILKEKLNELGYKRVKITRTVSSSDSSAVAIHLAIMKNFKGRLQVQIEQDLSSNYISGIHLIKKSVEQFIRSVVA